MAKHLPKKQIFDVGRTLPTKQDVPKDSGIQPPPQLYADEGKSKHWFKRILLSFLAALLAIVLVIGIWDGINISRATTKALGSGNLFSLLTPTGLKNSNGRVNILMVGYSVDDPGHPGATLTDSIMLVSLSQSSRSGYILSIPRDLYVNIPGFGYAKINEAYSDGGMSLLEQIVASDFQTNINYYALVDYAAVRDTVNALGGITVNVNSPDPRGLYDPNISPVDGGPLKLANGPQTLNGQTALNLTRARGDSAYSYGFPQADFDRTQHQRQVFTAIKDKLNWTLVLNPLKNGKIFSAIGNNVKTDITISEARPLFGLFRSVPNSSLQSLSLRDLNGKNYLSSYTTPIGQSALIPTSGVDDFSQINSALSQLNQ